MARTYICDCGQEYVPNVAKYKDLRVKCDACCRKTRARDVKAKAVAYLGGRCVDCDYSGHPVAFDFDHKNPKHKKFNLSGSWLFRWTELVKELKKCALRCSNCHRTRHYLEQYGE